MEPRNQTADFFFPDAVNVAYLLGDELGGNGVEGEGRHAPHGEHRHEVAGLASPDSCQCKADARLSWPGVVRVWYR